MTDRDTDHHDEASIEQALDRLGVSDRRVPDAGFEARVRDAMLSPIGDRVPGRRRRSTAWIPVVTAACVAIMGYIAWIPMLGAERDADTAFAVGAEPSTDILLSSFDAMDMLIADADEMGESLNWIELRIDAALFGLAADSTWQELGGSL